MPFRKSFPLPPVNVAISSASPGGQKASAEAGDAAAVQSAGIAKTEAGGGVKLTSVTSIRVTGAPLAGINRAFTTMLVLVSTHALSVEPEPGEDSRILVANP